jgi:hypothetical protein
VRWTNRKLPAARDEGLLIEHVANDVVVYDVESKEAHCLSSLPAVVFTHCDGQTSLSSLATIASEELGETVTETTVEDVIAQLQARDLLASARVSESDAYTRRTMLRKSAIVGGVVAGAPLISSVFAPPALAANSATCGRLLCCPCCTGSGFNKDDCCFHEGETVNCQCVSAQGNSSKKCKPAGNSAPSDQFCLDNVPDISPGGLCSQLAAQGDACLAGQNPLVGC